MLSCWCVEAVIVNLRRLTVSAKILVHVVILVGDCPENEDPDSDGVCGFLDSCPYDGANDADSDMICAQFHCEDAEPASGLVLCATYATGRQNAGFCHEDGLCETCPCACGVECGLVDVCPLDPVNDADSDGLCANFDSCPLDGANDVDSDSLCGQSVCHHSSVQGEFGACLSYADNRHNDGHCVEDGMCEKCLCECGVECGITDMCETDPENDIDSDNICREDDSCPYDVDNDADSDNLCAETACSDNLNFVGEFGSCVTYGPTRSNAGHCEEDDVCIHCGCTCASECRTIDPCPHDPVNDVDSDMVCRIAVFLADTTPGPGQQSSDIPLITLSSAAALLCVVTIGLLVYCLCIRGPGTKIRSTDTQVTSTNGVELSTWEQSSPHPPHERYAVAEQSRVEGQDCLTTIDTREDPCHAAPPRTTNQRKIFV